MRAAIGSVRIAPRSARRVSRRGSRRRTAERRTKKPRPSVGSHHYCHRWSGCRPHPGNPAGQLTESADAPCTIREPPVCSRRPCLHGSNLSRSPIPGLSIDPFPRGPVNTPPRCLLALTARRENGDRGVVARSGQRIRVPGGAGGIVSPRDLYQVVDAPSTHFRPRARRSPSHPRCGRDREETNATVAQSATSLATQLAHPRPTSCLRLCVDPARRTAKI